MELESVTFDDYMEEAKLMEEAVERLPEVSGVLREQVEVKKRRAEVLAKVAAVTDFKFNVIKKGPENVGGAAASDGTVFISATVLDPQNRDLAVKVGGHEKNHIKTGIRELDVEKELGSEHPEYLKTLRKVLGKDDIKKEFLMEGFTEYLTEGGYGYNAHCLYNNEEVPAAKKLERLCRLNTGESLLAAFEQGDKDLFFKRLKVLCEMLIIREKVGEALTIRN